MNKKAEFNWGLLVLSIVVGIIVMLMVWGIITSANETQEKFNNLCEKKGMEYFGHHSATFTHNEIVICLDNNGEQHEVQLR